MPYKTPVLLRKSAYKAQQGQCWYCGLPMWLSGVEEFANTHNFTLPQAQLLQCTAEHLHARQDGGIDTPNNVVAACRYCNTKRHKRKIPLPPEKYRKHVKVKMKKGGWHQLH
jgi:5-methylcytosine-specific restriction endonuclease McrA